MMKGNVVSIKKHPFSKELGNHYPLEGKFWVYKNEDR